MVTRCWINMPIAKTILAIIYALYIAWGLFFFNRIPIFALIVVVPCAITILALTGRGGNWTRIAALIFAALTLLQAFVRFLHGIWQFYTGYSESFLGFVFVLIFAAVSGWTIWILRIPTVRIDGLLRKAILIGLVIAAVSTVGYVTLAISLWAYFLGVSMAVFAGMMVYFFGTD